MNLIPFLLRMDYDRWTTRMEINICAFALPLLKVHEDDILSAILPEELHDDLPTGFNPVGHIGRVL